LRSGGATFLPAAVAALIDTSLARGAAADIDAERQRLATVASADDRFAVRRIWLTRLRALLAQARGDDSAYRGRRDQYRGPAKALAYEASLLAAADPSDRRPAGRRRRGAERSFVRSGGAAHR
jgi:adenylate cyclase